jgi:hypothetical protein
VDDSGASGDRKRHLRGRPQRDGQHAGVFRADHDYVAKIEAQLYAVQVDVRDDLSVLFAFLDRLVVCFDLISPQGMLKIVAIVQH